MRTKFEYYSLMSVMTQARKHDISIKLCWKQMLNMTNPSQIKV